MKRKEFFITDEKGEDPDEDYDIEKDLDLLAD